MSKLTGGLRVSPRTAGSRGTGDYSEWVFRLVLVIAAVAAVVNGLISISGPTLF